MDPYLVQLYHEIASVFIRINDERGGHPTVEDLAELAHIPMKIAGIDTIPSALAGPVRQVEESINAMLQRSAQLNGALMVDNDAATQGTPHE